MQTITIDTHEAIEALRAEKFTKAQAKIIVDTIRNVELYGVATSEDIRRLEDRINSFKSEIFKWGGALIVGVYALLVGVLLVLLKGTF